MNKQGKYSILPTLLLSILMPFCSVTAWADMYKYVDDKGAVSITDDLGKIPEKYRAKAEAVKEEKVQVVTQPAPTQPSENIAAKETAPPNNRQTTEATKKTSESHLNFPKGGEKNFIIAAAATIVFLAVLIFILNKYVKNKMVTRLIFLLIMAAVGIIVYKMYAENVYKQFSDAKKSTEQAKKLLEQKQKDQMKEIGELGK